MEAGGVSLPAKNTTMMCVVDLNLISWQILAQGYTKNIPTFGTKSCDVVLSWAGSWAVVFVVVSMQKN